MSKIAGIFILGVLAGWLIEWLFVRLFMPNPQKKTQKALDATRKENEQLQQQVGDLQKELAAAKTQVATKTAALEAKKAEALPEVTSVVEPELQAEVVPEELSTKLEAPAEPVQADATDDSDDDLTKVNGIGPKLAEAMKAAGIKRFSQLADMNTEQLSEALATSGIRYSKASAETWAAQAKLAAAGDWDGLKSFAKG